jgi:hypothetical protein
VEQGVCCPFIGRRGKGEGRGGGGVGARRPAINGGGGGSVEWRGGAVSRRGKAGRRRSGWRRLHLWRSGRGGGAQAAGEAVRSGGCAGKKGGRRPEEGDGPDRWAPPVGGCVREREGRRVGRVGRRRNGPVGFRGPLRRGEGKGGPRGRREGGPRGWADRVCFVFFFFFLFFSNPFLNQFQTF